MSNIRVSIDNGEFAYRLDCARISVLLMCLRSNYKCVVATLDAERFSSGDAAHQLDCLICT